MKASALIEQLLDFPGDFDVVIDGGDGVGELPVRWTGMGKGGKFGICVAVPEKAPDEAAYLRTLGIDKPSAKAPEQRNAAQIAAVIGAAEGIYSSASKVLTAEGSIAKAAAAEKLYDDMAVFVTGCLNHPGGDGPTAPEPAPEQRKSPDEPRPWLDREPPGSLVVVEIRAMPGDDEGIARRIAASDSWSWSVGGDSGTFSHGCWPDHFQYRAPPRGVDGPLAPEWLQPDAFAKATAKLHPDYVVPDPFKSPRVTWPKTVRRGPDAPATVVLDGVEYVHPDEHKRVVRERDSANKVAAAAGTLAHTLSEELQKAMLASTARLDRDAHPILKGYLDWANEHAQGSAAGANLLDVVKAKMTRLERERDEANEQRKAVSRVLGGVSANLGVQLDLLDAWRTRAIGSYARGVAEGRRLEREDGAVKSYAEALEALQKARSATTG